MNNIFDNIYNSDSSKLIFKLENSLLNSKKEFIVTANSEIFSFKNKKINNILTNMENIILCDGIMLTKIVSYYKKTDYNRIPGVELTEELLDLANVHSSKVYIYGSSLETLSKLKIVIKNRFSNIKLIGLKDGYFNKEDEIKKDIIETKPDLVLIALGVPKQELFINSIIDEVDKGIFIGVGGSLDVLSGVKKRAPKIMIKLNLEWLYRIFKEPNRLFKFIKSNYQLLKIFFEMRKKND